MPNPRRHITVVAPSFCDRHGSFGGIAHMDIKNSKKRVSKRKFGIACGRSVFSSQ